MAEAYRCEECLRIFGARQDFDDHNKQYHAGQAQVTEVSAESGGGEMGTASGDYRCRQCGATFPSQSMIEEHNRDIHRIETSPRR